MDHYCSKKEEIELFFIFWQFLKNNIEAAPNEYLKICFKYLKLYFVGNVKCTVKHAPFAIYHFISPEVSNDISGELLKILVISDFFSHLSHLINNSKTGVPGHPIVHLP